MFSWIWRDRIEQHLDFRSDGIEGDEHGREIGTARDEGEVGNAGTMGVGAGDFDG